MSANEAMPAPTTKTMKLRYQGICDTCGTHIDQGVLAVYDRQAKTVRCIACPTVVDDAVSPPAEDGSVLPSLASDAMPSRTVADVQAGVAGASAMREYERRRAAREERVRTNHPRLGGLILAVSDEPQSIKAWATGAAGEEVLGRRLDALDGVRMLHDRRIPRTKANIDHIAVAPTGIYVIDAKKYRGRPALRVEGGLIRPRTESLVVAGRNQSKLVAGVHKQTELVRSALASRGYGEVPVTGVLCFVAADWPLIGGAFWIENVLVAWPKKVAAYVAAEGGIELGRVGDIHRALAEVFSVA